MQFCYVGPFGKSSLTSLNPARVYSRDAMEMRTLILFTSLLTGLTAGARAQLPAPNAAGVGMGHLHLNVRDPAAHRAFWTTLGGTPVKLGGMEVIKFPDV